jgi:hypothetical protein
MNRLDGFRGESATLAKFLASVYPQWVDDATVSWREVEDGVLEVRVPSPCHRADGDLLIFFDGVDVTVKLSHWHTHFTVVPGRENFAASAVDLCRYLDMFLEDRSVLVFLYQNDAYIAGMSLWIGHGCTLSRKARDEVGHFIFRHQSTTRYEIRSWSGGLDESHHVVVGEWDRHLNSR